MAVLKTRWWFEALVQGRLFYPLQRKEESNGCTGRYVTGGGSCVPFSHEAFLRHLDSSHTPAPLYLIHHPLSTHSPPQVGHTSPEGLRNLAALRHTLRDRMLSSPLCDAGTFVAGLEDAYRRMWHKWVQAGLGGEGGQHM